MSTHHWRTNIILVCMYIQNPTTGNREETNLVSLLPYYHRGLASLITTPSPSDRSSERARAVRAWPHVLKQDESNRLGDLYIHM